MGSESCRSSSTTIITVGSAGGGTGSGPIIGILFSASISLSGECTPSLETKSANGRATPRSILRLLGKCSIEPVARILCFIAIDGGMIYYSRQSKRIINGVISNAELSD